TRFKSSRPECCVGIGLMLGSCTILTLPEYRGGNQTASAQRRECIPMTRRSFALARLRRHREAFLNPRLPQRCLAGDGLGRLIAVMVDVQRNQGSKWCQMVFRCGTL